MPTKLTTNAIERSTYVITATFTDEDGDAEIPNSGLTWTLTNEHGTVINSRTAVAITAASTINIVLSGADLDIDDGKFRVVTVEGTYNSTLGSNLPIKDEARFTVSNLTAVT